MYSTIKLRDETGNRDLKKTIKLGARTLVSSGDETTLHLCETTPSIATGQVERVID